MQVEVRMDLKVDKKNCKWEINAPWRRAFNERKNVFQLNVDVLLSINTLKTL